MTTLTRLFILTLLFVAVVACTSVPLLKRPAATSPLPSPEATSITVQPQDLQTAAETCPLTEPEWIKPPYDAAVQGSAAFGDYFRNADESIWASAWWIGELDSPLPMRAEGFKVGWFRPAGATLTISGQRIDAQAPPLVAHVPCCYPTRFQATGLFFPTPGCWAVNAKAADRELAFVVWVAP